ncbi:MAG: peptidase dimerization domain-containing protein, partial [bacterium]|nr:peptidase dimerization domain-containing protein [bacterium]
VQEETTSEHGARFYVEHLKQHGYQNLIVLGEGGFGVTITDVFDGILFLYEAEQKGLLWITITVHSTGGHGSIGGKTRRKNPVIRAAKVAQKLSSFAFPIKLERSVITFIEMLLNNSSSKLIRAVSIIPFFKAFLFRTRWGSILLDVLITRISRIPELFRTSLNVTNISTDKISGVSDRPELRRSLVQRVFKTRGRSRLHPVTTLGVNVVPTYATLTCDIRFNSYYNIESLLSQLKKVLPKDADLRIINSQDYSSSDFSLLHETVTTELKNIYGTKALASPILFIASSDNYFFRKAGHQAFGFSPIMVTMDNLQRIHGDDERIGIAAFRKGCEDYYCVIKSLLDKMK